jgi:hypothetical protein
LFSQPLVGLSIGSSATASDHTCCCVGEGEHVICVGANLPRSCFALFIAVRQARPAASHADTHDAHVASRRHDHDGGEEEDEAVTALRR